MNSKATKTDMGLCKRLKKGIKKLWKWYNQARISTAKGAMTTSNYYLIPVEQDLPPERKLVIGYSAIHYNYYIVQWTPSRGWLDQNGEDVRIITHFSNQDIYLPMPISMNRNEELARHYEFKPNNL